MLSALSLALILAASALADTIRLKDGQIIRGQIVSFRDQQFTVLIGSGAGGRRSRVTVYIDDIDSIEFDSAAGVSAVADPPAGDPYTPPTENARATQPQPTTTPRSTTQRPPTLGNDGGTSNSGNTTPSNTNAGRTNTGASSPAPTQPSTAGGGQFFPVRVRVRADSTANGWTDSGLMVRKGQKLRISATGRVSLGEGRFSTPTGLPRVVDTEKLMRNEPTGELIAVIGDDNDEFIPVGANREFYAPRDGRLFLGVNEGKLDDNTGTYEAVIEVEPVAGGGER
jgi:hypothetical protein